MIRPLTLVSLLAAGGAGLYLYQVKHSVSLLDRELRDVRRQTEAARERSNVLRAESALLNEPDRLRQVAERHLTLVPMAPGQFVRMQELDRRLPPPVVFAGAPSLFTPLPGEAPISIAVSAPGVAAARPDAVPAPAVSALATSIASVAPQATRAGSGVTPAATPSIAGGAAAAVARPAAASSIGATAPVPVAGVAATAVVAATLAPRAAEARPVPAFATPDPRLSAPRNAPISPGSGIAAALAQPGASPVGPRVAAPAPAAAARIAGIAPTEVAATPSVLGAVSALGGVPRQALAPPVPFGVGSAAAATLPPILR